MRCEYCRHGTDDGRSLASLASAKSAFPLHNPACPLASGKLDESKKIAYDAGYNEGRAGKKCSSSDLAYRMGWGRGDSALEAAENGCDRAIY